MIERRYNQHRATKQDWAKKAEYQRNMLKKHLSKLRESFNNESYQENCKTDNPAVIIVYQKELNPLDNTLE